MTILFNSSYSQACPHDHPCTHTHTQAYTVRLSKHHTLSTSVCRLKPIKPIKISIAARIQDPRSKIAQGSSMGILDLGSEPRLKFQSVSIGIQDSANRPLDNLGSWIPSPIEISIGLNRDPRFCQHTSGPSWILDLGSHPRLKFQSVSIGIQDSANRPLDNLGSWIPSPIEISTCGSLWTAWSAISSKSAGATWKASRRP